MQGANQSLSSLATGLGTAPRQKRTSAITTKL